MIYQNGVALCKRKELKCDRTLFCAFICAYWERHTEWIHSIGKSAKKFGHYSPLMLVRLMLMLDDLKELKTTQSSDFDNYKEIREGLPANDHENGIYSKDTEKNQSNDFFE